jgi:DHA1 family bicyclomycin/chloramphenicol resistance-like MFS transporter
MPVANARVLSLRPNLAGTASGLAAAVTVMGAGIIAFLSGLVVNASNAHVTVLGVMLATSVLSLVAILFIVNAKGERSA